MPPAMPNTPETNELSTMVRAMRATDRGVISRNSFFCLADASVCHGQTCSGHLDRDGTVPASRDRRDRPGDDTSTVLAKTPVVGYDFAKKNANAEKGELT